MSTQHNLPRADLGLYHGPRPDIYHSTEWSLNTRLSLHRGPRPGVSILQREWFSMILIWRMVLDATHKNQQKH